jgi:hypothetical protein
MTLRDQVESLTPGVVADLRETSCDARIRRPAQAWLRAYRLALFLRFDGTIARKHADRAWDRIVDELREEMGERLN